MAERQSPTAGIFCKDTRFARLLEIQLGFCGVAQVIYPADTPERALECLLWLVDLDEFAYETLPRRPQGCRVYGFTRSPELESAYGQDLAFCFHRPFAMTAFESVICQDLYGDGMPLPLRQIPAARQEPSRPRTLRREETLRVTHDGVILLEGREISLTGQERAVFDCLWEHRGRAVSKEALRERLSALPGKLSESNSPEVYICFLRRKLEQPTGRKLITTVRGVGYMLVEIDRV